MRLLTLIFLIPLLYACSSKKNLINKNLFFQKNQIEKILDEESNQTMPLFLITNPSDSILLRKKSMDISPTSTPTVLQHFAKRLELTMVKSGGVGIAAPQVGILKNIIVVQRLDKEEFPNEVYLNPRIIEYGAEKLPTPEGCLSIPEKRGTTQNRSKTIKITYQKLDGSQHEETVEGFTAVIFQHEIDHLNGILFIDHLEQEVKSGK
ncbi:MAG: peptide deformylase [Bacteroidota bacterium]